MSEQLPDHIQQFLFQHIESLAQLEVLLLLRSQSDRDWSAEEVSKALYTSADTSAVQLDDLVKRGFLAKDSAAPPRYKYAPEGSQDALVKDVAAIYQERRVSVITLIYSKPVNKVQTFADAFRIRKE
jgi:hypothetical protein